MFELSFTMIDLNPIALDSNPRQPPQPPSQFQTSGSSNDSRIPIIFRDNLQAQRYELFQGSVVYVCGRNVNWNAIINEPFGTKLKTLLTNMDWIGLDYQYD